MVQPSQKIPQSFDQFLKKRNILQPYDFLGGYCIADFFFNLPDYVEAGLADIENYPDYSYKPTILDNFFKDDVNLRMWKEIEGALEENEPTPENKRVREF